MQLELLIGRKRYGRLRYIVMRELRRAREVRCGSYVATIEPRLVKDRGW